MFHRMRWAIRLRLGRLVICWAERLAGWLWNDPHLRIFCIGGGASALLARVEFICRDYREGLKRSRNDPAAGLYNPPPGG